MRLPLLILLAALLGAGSAVLVACGGDDSQLIPERDAEALKRYADRVGADVRSEDCRQAAANVQAAQDRIAELPPEVDDDLRANLEEGFNNLAAQAARECDRAPTTPTTPTTTEPTTTEDTTTTESVPTEPDTTPEPPVEPPTDPGDGGGGDGGGGGGGGDGGGGGGGDDGGGDTGGSGGPSQGGGSPAPGDRR